MRVHHTGVLRLAVDLGEPSSRRRSGRTAADLCVHVDIKVRRRQAWRTFARPYQLQHRRLGEIGKRVSVAEYATIVAKQVS